MYLVIVSGRSGSGKTVALHALVDLGYYCIDNLPIALLSQLNTQFTPSHPWIAVSIDARNAPADPQELAQYLQEIKAISPVRILYLDANDHVLLKRFSETRRKHPLTTEQHTLKEAIQSEHTLLSPLINTADWILDTSQLSTHELHYLVRDRVPQKQHTHMTQSSLQILIQSFGFKHGIPPYADYIFDVRCLPNPYWIPELRACHGQDPAVISFLQNQPLVQAMLKDITHFLDSWIPRFSNDNRRYLTIAIGCTGGRHRSVFIADCLLTQIQKRHKNLITQVRHRELSS
jgi:UPF0042 nucleotide-binding protein